MEGKSLCPVIGDDDDVDDEWNNATSPPLSLVPQLPTLAGALLLLWGADFTMVALDFVWRRSESGERHRHGLPNLKSQKIKDTAPSSRHFQKSLSPNFHLLRSSDLLLHTYTNTMHMHDHEII